MMWRNWNKADKTLLFAAVVFAFALCLNLEYRDNVFAKGFLFCAEAALVGGIADWFAVTALFEKPLGFPWHTAILPRKRQSFIEATGRMLQQEFFGRKILIKKIRQIDFAAKVLAWLDTPETRQKMAAWLVNALPQWLHKYGQASGQALDNVAAMELNAQSLRPLADYGIRELHAFVKQPEFQHKAKTMLENYIDSKLKGPMAMMMAGFAQSMNIINEDEAAELVQKKLARFLERMQQADTAEYHQLQESLENIFNFYEKNLAVKQELHDVLLNRMKKLNYGDYLLQENDQLEGRMQQELEKLLGDLLAKAIGMLSANAALQRELNGLVYQMAARGALQAQDMLGKIANDVLGTMTDEQINRLVYDKAEPDLLWIRMNGSIVGASIGLVLFVIVQFI